MPITIFNYVKSVVGDKEIYSAEDCYRNGVAPTGGCQRCQATLHAGNAYPSTSGYWRCADCIGSQGFATVADFTAHEAAIVACPACGNTDTISEIRITTSEDTEAYALECGDCGQVWQS